MPRSSKHMSPSSMVLGEINKDEFLLSKGWWKEKGGKKKKKRKKKYWKNQDTKQYGNKEIITNDI